MNLKIEIKIPIHNIDNAYYKKLVRLGFITGFERGEDSNGYFDICILSATKHEWATILYWDNIIHDTTKTLIIKINIKHHGFLEYYNKFCIDRWNDMWKAIENKV